MELISAISSFTVPPQKGAVVYAVGPQGFSSVASSQAGQYLAAVGVNNYAFINYFATSPISFGVINATFTTISGGSPIPSLSSVPIGNNSTNYDVAAQALGVTWGVASQLSSVNVTTSVTLGVAQGLGYLNIYADPGQLPAPETSGNSVESNYTVGTMVAPAVSGFSYGNISFIVPVSSYACAFSSVAGTSAGYPGDFMLVEEIVPLNSNDLLTATCTSTSATPVTLFTIVSSALTSFFVTGTVVFGDAGYANSNSLDFMFILQQGTSGPPVVTAGPGDALAISPGLSYSITGNTLTVSVVGIASYTYNCKASYRVLAGIEGV